VHLLAMAATAVIVALNVVLLLDTLGVEIF
jgi:hypothetical protein